MKESTAYTREEDTVYVLGSGASMLRMSAEEKRFLAVQTTVAMNKYLLFWEVLGLWPSHFFLGDIHYPALRVYEASVAEARRVGRPVHFFLAEEYRRIYSGNLLSWVMNPKITAKHLIKQQYIYHPWVRHEPVTFFRRCQTLEAPEAWAESLDEWLYFYRGSLSVLLNLLTVVRLGRRIKLIGVDLNTPDSFFDDHLPERPWLVDRFMRMQRQGEKPMHMTARSFQGLPGIHHKFPYIMENIHRCGCELFCCNPDSLLIQEALCPYAPILETPV